MVYYFYRIYLYYKDILFFQEQQKESGHFSDRRSFFMQDIRQTIAENLIAARKAAHLTQAELAEKLNYSDKAVSKWERGDSIPDVIVLKQIADLFSVTVDYFLTPHTEDEALPSFGKAARGTRIAILLTLVIGTAALAFLLFWIFSAAFPEETFQWKIFIAMIPALFIELLVFTSLFGRRYLVSAIAVSGIVIGALLTAFFFIDGAAGVNFPSYYIFILGAPAVLIVVVWHILAYRRRSRTRTPVRKKKRKDGTPR